LTEAQSVHLNRDQAHYLFSVMRKSEGDHVAIFDGKNGEWLAQIDVAGKKKAFCAVLK
jgi:16S rRNA (uracil1498-N3)-methyltransferase